MTATEEQNNDAALAGEYVLRLLDADEQRHFEIRLATDPELRELVRDWDAALVPLSDQIAPVTPPPALKAAVQSRLFPQATPAPGGWRRWFAGGLVAASVVLAVVLLGPTLVPQDDPTATLSASVASEDGTLVIAANFFAEENSLTIARQSGAALPGRVLELWLIADGATAPVSLGVLSADPETRLSVPDALAQQLAGGVLAVSDEPPGGSPTGAPTGAVLATGVIVDL